MEFLILNRTKVSKISPEVPYVVISATEPENKLPKIKGMLNGSPYFLGVLRLTYTDEDDPERSNFFGQGHLLMSDDQAFQVCWFVNRFKDRAQCIISQCDGGISRSSGTAAAFSDILNGARSSKWIFDSPAYVPNMYVYRKILNTWQQHFATK